MKNHKTNLNVSFTNHNLIIIGGLIDNYSNLDCIIINSNSTIRYCDLDNKLCLWLKSILLEELEYQFVNYPSKSNDIKLNDAIENGKTKFQKLNDKLVICKITTTEIQFNLTIGYQYSKFNENESNHSISIDTVSLLKHKEYNQFMNYQIDKSLNRQVN